MIFVEGVQPVDLADQFGRLGAEAFLDQLKIDVVANIGIAQQGHRDGGRIHLELMNDMRHIDAARARNGILITRSSSQRQGGRNHAPVFFFITGTQAAEQVTIGLGGKVVLVKAVSHGALMGPLPRESSDGLRKTSGS